jgi:hypothetical protein
MKKRSVLSGSKAHTIVSQGRKTQMYYHLFYTTENRCWWTVTTFVDIPMTGFQKNLSSNSGLKQLSTKVIRQEKLTSARFKA